MEINNYFTKVIFSTESIIHLTRHEDKFSNGYKVGLKTKSRVNKFCLKLGQANVWAYCVPRVGSLQTLCIKPALNVESQLKENLIVEIIFKVYLIQIN